MQGQKHVQYSLTYVWLLSVTKDNSFRNLLNTFKHQTVFPLCLFSFSSAFFSNLHLSSTGCEREASIFSSRRCCRRVQSRNHEIAPSIGNKHPYSYRHLGKNAFLLHIPFFLYLFLRFEFCTARIDTLHILPFLHVLLGIVSCRFFYLALRVFFFPRVFLKCCNSWVFWWVASQMCLVAFSVASLLHCSVRAVCTFFTYFLHVCFFCF